MSRCYRRKRARRRKPHLQMRDGAVNRYYKAVINKSQRNTVDAPQCNPYQTVYVHQVEYGFDCIRALGVLSIRSIVSSRAPVFLLNCAARLEVLTLFHSPSMLHISADASSAALIRKQAGRSYGARPRHNTKERLRWAKTIMAEPDAVQRRPQCGRTLEGDTILQCITSSLSQAMTWFGTGGQAALYTLRQHYHR